MNGYKTLPSSQQQQVSKPNVLASVWAIVSPPLITMTRFLIFILSIITPIVWVGAFGVLAYFMLFRSPTKVSKRMGSGFIVMALLPILIVVVYVLMKRVLKGNWKQAFQCVRKTHK